MSKENGRDTVKLEGVMDAKEVITYLEDVLAGLKAGSVCITVGEQCLTLKPGGDMEFRLKATQTRQSEKVSLEVGWKRPEELGAPVSTPDDVL